MFRTYLLSAVSLIMPLISSHAAVEVNGIAAIANGKVITKRETAFMLAPLNAQLQAKYPRRGETYATELEKAKDDILDELIDRELILSEFENKLQGSLPREAVEEEVQRQIRETYNGNEEEFLKQLRELRMDRSKYEELTEKKLIVQAMRAQQFNDAPPPTPGEIKEEYDREKRNFRDVTKDKIVYEKIYISKLGPNNVPMQEEMLTLAESLAEQIKGGADFATLAKEHSVDAYAEDGGQWPKVDRTELSPPFAAIIFGEDTGTVIGPLEDQFGFTIVRVKEKIDGPSPPLDKVRKNIEARVQRQKNSERYERWISRIRDGAIIRKRM